MKVINYAKFDAKGIDVHAAAARIKLLALDVDGVLTDGGIGYGPGGAGEIKFFSVRDGSGVTMLHRADFLVGIISGRQSIANATRAAELKMDFLVEKSWNKLQSLKNIAEENHLELDECLFVGDDFIDGETLANCGIGVAVADAAPELLIKAADMQTEAAGGRGAVREIAEWLLKEQGKWEAALDHYRLPR